MIHSKSPVNDKRILGNEEILSEFREEAIEILQRFYVSEEELQFISGQTRIDMEDNRIVEILDKMVEKYYREIIDNQVVDYEM